MDKKIVEDIKRLAFEVLKNDRIINEENFNFNEAENMDSVNRVAVLVAIENEYNESSSWNTVMKLAAIIEKTL